MSQGVPRITADDIIRIIKPFGFSEVRQSGSHKIFRNPEGIRITVPYHKGKILHPKIVKAVIRDLRISSEEFQNLI